MFRHFRKKHGRFAPVLIAVLAAAALLSAIGGTAAWLRYARSLNTLTRIQVPSLTLTGPGGQDTIPVELGDIDLSKAGSTESVFRIESTSGTSYIIQLAHTTNLPLRYTIYKLENASGTASTTLTGKYLNGNGIADNTLHAATYGTYASVQKNAEPLYWQSTAQVSNGEDYYKLTVAWEAGTNNKETDMIYITAGIGGNYEETQP